jgi:hypothetical protein
MSICSFKAKESPLREGSSDRLESIVGGDEMTYARSSGWATILSTNNCRDLNCPLRSSCFLQ